MVPAGAARATAAREATEPGAGQTTMAGGRGRDRCIRCLPSDSSRGGGFDVGLGMLKVVVGSRKEKGYLRVRL
jgi:hypothetical protein